MLDLFSGIGGFSLAAKWVWGDDLEIAGFCEIDKYCQKVLAKNFPGVPIHDDIKKLNGNDFKNIDIITGGFPCQDISVAGKGAGLEGSRSGLWFEMRRIISEVRPRYALIENVPMLTIRGGTRVIADLAEIGMDAEWQIIGADDVGAWHRRKRIWIVAYPNCWNTNSEIRWWSDREIPQRQSSNTNRNRKIRENIPDTGYDESQRRKESKERYEYKRRRDARSESTSFCSDVPDSESKRHGRRDSEECGNEGRQVFKEKQGRSKMGSEAKGCGESFTDVPDTEYNGSSPTDGQREKIESSKPTRTESIGKFERRSDLQDVPDTESIGMERHRPVEQQEPQIQTGERISGCNSAGSGTDYWSTEPNVGRVAHGIPARVDRLKGLGNAIVPQCAALIMERIKDCE